MTTSTLTRRHRPQRTHTVEVTITGHPAGVVQLGRELAARTAIVGIRHTAPTDSSVITLTATCRITTGGPA